MIGFALALAIVALAASAVAVRRRRPARARAVLRSSRAPAGVRHLAASVSELSGAGLRLPVPAPPSRRSRLDVLHGAR